MLRIHPRHLAPDLCHRGARRWFAEHDLSWATFVSEGYDVEIIKATGDHFGLLVVERAEKEAANGRQ